MEREDYDMLKRELLSRLPYGVRVMVPGRDTPASVCCVDFDSGSVVCGLVRYHIEDVRLVLRPMSEMRGFEGEEISRRSSGGVEGAWSTVSYMFERGLDFNHLIGRGLAVSSLNLCY